MSFVHLHGHSHYSLLDGFGSPKDIILRAKELGLPAVALTDHGVVHGLIEFYKAGKEEGIKPILGCEIYVAPRTRFDKEAKIDNKPYHLTLLAKDFEGYQNLLRLVTKGNLEGFYYKPRVDLKLLKTYSKGLIALSGCLAGNVSRAILSESDKVDSIIKEHVNIFGEGNYYLEMQHHPLIENQDIVNKKMKELSKKHDVPLVVTNDYHYPRPDDNHVHDIMICIQTQTTINDESRMRYTGDFSMRSYEELKEAFKDVPEALENTLKIAEKCNVELKFDQNLIPSFPTLQNEKPEIYLKQLCMEGLEERFEGKEVPKDYVERLNFELKTVHNMGFDTYFLIVHDFVKFAKDQGIVVGPGRGSAAGSILAWSLKITDMDPILYGLFFERFLNPERVSMPDIDIDFADHRRDEVLDYVVERYGRDNVAQIITFGTMAPRAAVRDAGRALGYPYAEVDVISKTVPPPVLGKHVPLKESVEDDPGLSDVYNKDARAKTLLDIAIKLEGTVRHTGTHACAVIISEKPLTEYTALQYGSGSKGEIVTQFSADPLEKIGLLKMDFLGLRNLTVIENTQKIVKVTRGDEIDIETISLEDKKTFELFQRGETTGVFQFESGGMKRYLKQLKPTIFDDIVAMGALYRPGPMDWIPTYIEGKHNPDKVEYLHESFKTILANTYGVAVYQEQILQLARDFAGFSLGEADLLRKAVGKKIPSLLEEQREKFVKGAVSNKHKEKFAKEVFEKVVEPFAGYGFNKAHAVCYGMIAYQTAYLKAHYPIEFMTALLQSDAANTERVVLEIKECSEMGMEILPPSINESLANFSVVGKNQIRFGLMAIKGVGEGPIDEIVKARNEGGKFVSIEDFAQRVPSKVVNKKIVQALALSGAMDEFGERNQVAENYDEISKFAKSAEKSASNGQTDIFGMMEDGGSEFAKLTMREVPKLTDSKKLKFEKELMGMYVSGHPFKGVQGYLSRKGSLIGNLRKDQIGKKVKITGIISEYRKILLKNGGYLATFMVEDSTAKLNAVIFPYIMKRIKIDLMDDYVVHLNGKLEYRRDQYQIICDEVKVLHLPAIFENAKEANLFNPEEIVPLAVPNLDDVIARDSINTDENLESISPQDTEILLLQIPKGMPQDKMAQLKELLKKHTGDTPVEIMLESVNKKIRLPFGIKLDNNLKKQIDSLLKV